MIIISVLSFASNADCAFFDVPSVGARADGTGGARTAVANDALSAIFYNPAGLSDVHGGNAVIGCGAVRGKVHYKSTWGYDETSKKNGYAPFFAFSGDKYAPIFWAIGMYGNLGAGFDYEKDPAHGIFHDFTFDMVNMCLTPTVAYKFNDRISLGLGINICYGKIDMGMPLGPYSLEFDVDGFSYGVNLGIQYKANEYLSLGLRWRSRMKANYRGDANFSGVKDGLKASVYWPDVVTFGIGVHLSSQFLVLVDLEWIDYSRFSRKSHLSFDNLTFLDSPFMKDMKDAKRIHAGCEYLVNEKLAFRVGYLYNPRCFPKDQISPLTPANTFHTVHLGIGYKIKDNLDIDFTVDKGFSKKTKVTASETGYTGTYDNDATSINLGFSFHF